MINMKDIIKDTKDMKLLYVEDNKETRESTLLVLKNLFDNIFVATNGQEGLELFEENSDIDIVITDINMPVKNGLQMSEDILKINNKIPIFIFSAHNEAEYFVDAIKIGIEGYLLKPLSLDQFLQVLTKYLDKRALEKNHEKIEHIIHEREKIELILKMVKNISHHWKQPLTLISAISSGCTLKKELGLELTDDDFKGFEQITNQADILANILCELEKIDFDNILLSEIEQIINISKPLYK